LELGLRFDLLKEFAVGIAIGVWHLFATLKYRLLFALPIIIVLILLMPEL
jgi:hypothetical protein